MKKIALLLLLSGTVAIKSVSAQTTDPLKLSDPYPAVGEKINIAYDPAGTPLAGKSGLDAQVYFLDNKDYPAADIDLKADGKIWKGELTIPATAKAFFIKLSQDGAIDNNNEKGYVYLVYHDKKPVEGAYAMKAYMLYSGMGAALAKIKTDMPEALNLYQKEFELYPGSKKEYQANYALLLSVSADPAAKALAEQQITQMAQSGDEKSMSSAVSLLRRMKKTAQADSLNEVVKGKFPEAVAKNEMGMAFSKEKDPAKKEELYKEYITKYPENPEDKKPIQDNFRIQLASAYLQSGKYEDYNRIVATVKEKSNLAGVLNNAAYTMAKKGENLEEAANLSKQSLDFVKEKIDHQGTPVAYQSPKSLKKNYEATYDMYADTYAFILLKENKFKEAAAVQQPVYEHSKGMDAEVNEHYALILKGLGEDKKAMQVIEAAMKTGRSSEAMDGALKDLYVKTKGSDKGYDSYLAALKSASGEEIKNKLAKEMINQHAPAFALKDFDGKTVSLADLKGKVVILDFWATWCGPCKASFPGMQIALNKYKDNPNVKFLFIDTWERVDDYLPGVKKFIADNNYSFKVLMDEKGSDGKQSKVVTAYGVEGIPTKFVLDGNGNIRFKHIGWDGSTQAVVDEVSAMIDMAAHPNATPAGEKVTMIKTK